MSIDLLNTCAACIHSRDCDDGVIWCYLHDETVYVNHVCDDYEFDKDMHLKLLSEDNFKTCNDCQHYDPADGICTKNGEERHFLDDKCELFEQQRDTEK